ncbi:MAG: hypothetical protein GY851_15525 [bacterium]|nr:hypothetical protein [bacterium]
MRNRLVPGLLLLGILALSAFIYVAATATAAPDLLASGILARSSPVHVLEHLKDHESKRISVTATTSTLQSLGLTFHTDIRAVSIVNRSDTDALHYNPVGAATTSNAGFASAQSYTIYGDSSILSTVQLKMGSMASNVDFIQHIIRQQ